MMNEQELDRMLQEILSNVSPYEAPKKEPIYHDKEMKIFMETFRKVESQFDIEKADMSILKSIFAWVWRWEDDNEIGLDYSKGLFLYGSIGMGKTFALRVLRQYLIDLSNRHPDAYKEDYRLGTYWKSASQLAAMFACKGIVAIEEYIQPDCCLFIDEVGREPNPVNNFGTKMDVIQFLLQTRYEDRRSNVTHITTNLSLKEFTKIYGDYVADRCLEMFNFIPFEGESLRKQ